MCVFGCTDLVIPYFQDFTINFSKSRIFKIVISCPFLFKISQSAVFEISFLVFGKFTVFEYFPFFNGKHMGDHDL